MCFCISVPSVVGAVAGRMARPAVPLDSSPPRETLPPCLYQRGSATATQASDAQAAGAATVVAARPRHGRACAYEYEVCWLDGSTGGRRQGRCRRRHTPNGGVGTRAACRWRRRYSMARAELERRAMQRASGPSWHGRRRIGGARLMGFVKILTRALHEARLLQRPMAEMRSQQRSGSRRPWAQRYC